MKIKIAILDKDNIYLERLVYVLNLKYTDKLQVYSFTDLQIAVSSLYSENINILIASYTFDIDFSILPKRCCFAFLVDSKDIDTMYGQRAICKYQRVDLIYKQILDIYSEKAENITKTRITDNIGRMFTFSSPAGGTGTSVMAAACSIYYASKGFNTLYLNLENYGSSDMFFSGEGNYDMSDVIFTVKSKKRNLSMKLESYIKKDESGVYFFSQPRNALDIIELSHNERMQLLNELRTQGTYDFIILDTDFGIDMEHIELFDKSTAIIMVSDGTEIANYKTDKAIEALTIIDRNNDISIVNRLCLIYNKFSNKISEKVHNEELRNIGGSPVYKYANVLQVVEQLSVCPFFENLNDWG